jgi:type I restriction enzyme M protein
MVETITEQSGRVGVVVPHGVLFRASAEGKIRRKLIEENILDAVVGLPANLFYGTGIPTVILTFRKNKSDSSVVFIDASRDYEAGKSQNRLRVEDIDKIVSTYHSRRSAPKYAYVADVSEIRKNDFNLNLPRYVDMFEEEKQIDIQQVQADIESLDVAIARVQRRIAGHLKELGDA